MTIFFGVVALGALAGRLAVLRGIGIPTTTVGFGLGIIWRCITTIIFGLLLRHLIFCAFNAQGGHRCWQPMVLGVVLLVFFTAVPVLGWLARLVIVLLGLRAIWIWGPDILGSRRTSQLAVQSQAATQD